MLFIDDLNFNRAMELQSDNRLWYKLAWNAIKDRGLRWEWFI